MALLDVDADADADAEAMPPASSAMKSEYSASPTVASSPTLPTLWDSDLGPTGQSRVG